MTRYFTFLMLIALTTICAMTARAGTFDFSYSFLNDPRASGLATCTGTLTGTQIGDSTTGYLIDVTVESLFVNGVQITGPILNKSSGFTFGGNDLGESAVPFNLGLDSNTDDYNLRFFSNEDDGFFNAYHTNDGYWSDTGYTFVSAWSGPGNPIFNNWNWQPLWSVTSRTTAVPESSTTVSLLCLSLVCLSVLRRKFGLN